MRRRLLTRWIAVLAAVVLCLMAQSVEALMIPPDPFDATDRYALLILSPDRQTVITVMVKVKSPTPAPLGPGQLGARIRYQLPGPPARNAIPPSYEVVSKPRPIDDLGNEATLMSFDFSIQPLPADAQHRVLEIFYVASEPAALPEPVAELAPERLLLRPGGDVVEQTLSPSEAALAGRILAGPVILLRERGAAISETISFTVSDSTGRYLLHLFNGEHTGSHRVASAEVRLNGKALFSPRQFNSNTSALRLPLSVQPGDNRLEIIPHGLPGTLLTATVAQLDPAVCRAMGPRTLLVATGNPNAERLAFPLPPQLRGPYTLHIINGISDGTRRVNRATVFLNHSLVLDLDAVQTTVPDMSTVVDLLSSNILTVSVSGEVGDRLAIEILGHDTTPPWLTVTAPTAAVDTALISLQGTVDDPSAIVTVNDRMATVTSDGRWSIDPVALQQGDNVLTVIATDSCGNSHETQVTVFRR